MPAASTASPEQGQVAIAPRLPVNVLLPARRGLARVRVALRFWAPLIPLGLFAGLLCLFGSQRLSITLPSPVGNSLLAVCFIVVLVAAFHRMGRNSRRKVPAKCAALKRALAARPRPGLRELLAPGPELDRLLLDAADEEDLACLLEQAAFCGEAVCLSTRRERLSIDFEAFPVPFEPLPLDRASVKLLDPLVSPEASRVRVDFAVWGKMVRQAVIVSRRSGILEGICGFFLFGLLTHVATGRLTLGDLVRAGILLVTLVGYLHTERVTGRLFLIPGGLINVRTKRVYRRDSALMIWCADSRLLRVSTCDSGTSLSFTVTPAEAAVALRAWLSPVPPPSDEMLEAFLAGRS